MRKKKLRDLAPILLALTCAAVFGGLMLAGVIDLKTIPQLVADQPVLAVLVVAGFYVAKGFSGVVVYNVLVVVVSMIFDLPTALIINSLGTAVTLSISYFLGRCTRTESLEELLDKHPKMKRYFTSSPKYGFVFCFAMHLLGLNMELLGLLFGLLRTRYLTYLAASCLAIAPGMVCLTIAGAELNFRSPLFWVMLAINTVMVIFGVSYTARKIKKEKQSAQAEAGAAEKEPAAEPAGKGPDQAEADA